MRLVDVVSSAASNTFRSKSRTVLTILAIFVGAFTLTITTGLGTGIKHYIDETVAQLGGSDVMTVSHRSQQDLGSGPQPYNPDQVAQPGFGGGAGVPTIDPIDQADLDRIAAMAGVLSVEPIKQLDVDYVQAGAGIRYKISLGSLMPGSRVQLETGAQPDGDARDAQVVIPVDYIAPLGFASPEDAVGATVTFGLTDHRGAVHTVTARVVGVAANSLTGGSSATPNAALTDAIYTAQSIGLPADRAEVYASAAVRFDANASAVQVQALKDSLHDAGYQATTVEDIIGAFKTVIDGITMVLNAFAIIALLAAGFGIVNTLLMSVQERTREIGLMKAMGMSSGKVFGLFSAEATYIGFLGSAIGVVAAVVVGTLIARWLSGGLLANLPGLRVFAFDPVSLAYIVLLVMVIAFLAGTLPAIRAARQDPITSLRYE